MPFTLGVDCYPEQWPEQRWPEDAQLMAEAGFNVVRLAEFAWSKMQPQEGHYDFEWLDRAIALLASHGMRVVLGTPTASPPPWLMTRYPEIFRVREDGVPVTFGNRREYCPNHPVYHDHRRRIVTRMAERYANHPHVIGWQIDNEFGDRCYCPFCASAFHAWLRRRYQTLDALNGAWGTTFWSHVYGDWAEIPLPLSSAGAPNPGLALDFYHFASDSYVAYQQLQLAILREYCPSHFVTHNFMGFGYDRIDYFDLARDLDFVSWDNYPRTQWSMQADVDPSQAALAHDTMRGLKRRNFWVMEQQAGRLGDSQRRALASCDCGPTNRSRTAPTASSSSAGARRASGRSSSGTACSTMRHARPVGTPRSSAWAWRYSGRSDRFTVRSSNQRLRCCSQTTRASRSRFSRTTHSSATRPICLVDA